MQSKIQFDKLHHDDPNVIVVNVRGLMNVKPDALLAIFNITQIGETAHEANELLNKRYKSFVSEISNFVSTEDIYLDMVSQVPVYEVEVNKKLFSKTYNEVPAGFELQKNIHVLFRKADALDKILEAAAKHEIYDLIKVDYFVENESKAYTELEAELMKLVNEKTKSYNTLLNVKLDTVYKTIQENKAVTYPMDRYSRYTPASSSSVEALKKRGAVTTVRKPVIMFYNKLSYHNFDVIINPIFVEPVVQYTYQIKVQYHRKRPTKVNVQNHYKIITPNGDVKTIEIK